MLRLLGDVRDSKVKVIVVNKVEMIRRLVDFSMIVKVLDEAGASLVSER